MVIGNGMRISILAFALAVALTGCDKKESAESSQATQVAARVNDDEITVHQINFEMAKLSGGNAPSQSEQTANHILNSLIDHHLLAQKAIDEKIDRDPQVLQTLESNRRQILVQAYLQRLAEQAIKPTAAEIDDYYVRNPALFSERRIYRLQEVSIPVTPENSESVKAKLAGIRNMQELAEWLKSVSIPARATQSVKAAEQLPLEILPQLHALKDGKALTLASPNSLNIFYLVGSQTQPISKEQAAPAIERFLLTARKRDLAQAEIKKLRESAKLEYMGEFAKAANTAPASPVQGNGAQPPSLAGRVESAGQPSAAAQ